MYKEISDYGIIGNLRTVALVGMDGSIDWMCLPFIDSPSVFGALLDESKGGKFHICPSGEFDSTARYLEGANILETSMRTRSGVMRLTDFMPVTEGQEKDESAPVELYRIIEVMEGEVEVELHLMPAFDYARAEDISYARFDGGVVASTPEESVSLASDLVLELKDTGAHARFLLGKGQLRCFRLMYGKSLDPIAPEHVHELLSETAAYWRRWLATKETGRSFELGQYKEMVDRSALLLKLLLFAPTGAIAAAATTSLPEEVGGERNWDYRYTWVRDTSFTLQALFDLGHLSETENYLNWMSGLISSGEGVEGMKIMYGLRGEKDLKEQELEHLEGYKGSRPVRIGNGAAEQMQLDIYGELMDASLKLSDYVGKIDSDSWPFLRSVCSLVVSRWVEPDAGIWEVRGGPYHFVHSKLMCWVALDRGLTIAKRYGFPADLNLWKKTRQEIKREILEKGWNQSKRAFRQHYDTEALDASGLLVTELGFLPPDDPRAISNIEAIGRELSHDGFIYRYKAPDGLKGNEGTFLLCTLWYIDALIALGRLNEAEALLRKVEGTSNHLGLFSEEYDVKWKQALGNFPQAFTHIGYINSVMKLLRARSSGTGVQAPEDREGKNRLRWSIVLNQGDPEAITLDSGELGVRLKNTMNVLRGAFFDTTRGRVAYEHMRGSQPYEAYLKLSHALNDMDLTSLVREDEKKAFWINLYNVAVIHGVIELGVRDSVKEVWWFFRRLAYNVDGMKFNLRDIEHGVIRANRRPPGSVLKPFANDDPRRQHALGDLDPRVHFALVCASSSCPPIGVYTSEGIVRELDIAAATFINSGGLVLDRESETVSLSRIFKWYAKDFGRTLPERLRFISRYLYNEPDRIYINENADRLRVLYQQYDWRLNRS